MNRTPKEKASVLPLAGMKVIELTHAWAGPLCGMMLGDMGAEVIKVESPDQDAESRGGAPYHAGESVIFMMTHRNKKSVTLDLKDSRGYALFIELVKTADVLLNNMRPGTLDRLGLGYEKLREIHPRLIYTSVSGFGRVGPDAGQAGVDQIAVAVSGLAATTMVEPTSLPATLGVPVCDITAAMWACHGTLCAYIARGKTGCGQRVDASLLEAGLSLMINPTAQHFFTPGYTGRKTAYNGASEFLLCSDGKYVSIFASYPALWDRFVKALNMDRITNDARFKTRASRTTNARQLREVLAEIFLARPSNYWITLLREAGVPASAVNTIGEAFQDPQVQATEMLQEQEHPRAGPLHLVGVAVKLSDTPGGIRTPAPALGEHTEEVLAELKVSKGTMVELKTASVI